jgi:hypothetical protein
MAWALHEAKLPEDCKGYLSLLGGCGDEKQAMAEAEVNHAQVQAWSRLPAFSENHRQALEHFASWNTPQRSAADDWGAPPRWGGPRFDPFHRRLSAIRERASSLDWLSWLKLQAGHPPADTGRAAPGETRFIPITDMSPAEARAAAQQQMPPRDPAKQPVDPFYRKPNPDSYPQQLDKDGHPVPEGFLVVGGVARPLADTWSGEGMSDDGARWNLQKQ